MVLLNNLATLVAIILAASLVLKPVMGEISPTILALVQQYQHPHCRGDVQYQDVSSIREGCNIFRGPKISNAVKVFDIRTGKLVEDRLTTLSFTCANNPFTAFGNGNTIACPKSLHKAINAFCFAYYRDDQFLF